MRILRLWGYSNQGHSKRVENVRSSNEKCSNVNVKVYGTKTSSEEILKYKLPPQF